ncbi:hypothetical protein KFL_015500010, partial [Klebsormidium nitens]
MSGPQSGGYDLRSRRIPPRQEEVSLLDESGSEDRIEVDQSSHGFREESLGPFQSLFFEGLDDMDSTFRPGGVVFTGDPASPSLQSLRQAWRAKEVELKLKPRSDELLNDNDRFHLAVGLLGGGARERAFHLESTMEVELLAANAPARAQFATRTRAWQLECELWDGKTETERGDTVRPVRPVALAFEKLYFQPMERFWAMLEELHPERSSAKISEYNLFTQNKGESLANMFQRMKFLMVTLNQPEQKSVFKLLDCLKAKHMASEVESHLNHLHLDPNLWTVDQVSNIALQIERGRSEKELWTGKSSHSDTVSNKFGSTSSGELAPNFAKEKPQVKHARSAKKATEANFASMSAADKQAAYEDWQAKQSGCDGPADAYTGEIIELNEPLVPALATGTEKKRRSSETQQLKGVQGNMPLSFLPYDATSTERLRGGKDLEYDPFQVSADQGESETAGLPKALEKVPGAGGDSELPQSFEELATTDPRYQGKADYELPTSQVVKNPVPEDEIPGENFVTDLFGVQKPLYGYRNAASRDGLTSDRSDSEAQSGLDTLGKVPDTLLTGPFAHAELEGDVTADMELGGRQGRHGTVDPFAEPPVIIEGGELLGEYRDIAPEAWPPAVRANYHTVEVQALLGGPVTDDVRDAVRALGDNERLGITQNRVFCLGWSVECSPGARDQVILDQADRWSQSWLWKHLAWALRNCEMAGFRTMRDIFVCPADSALASARRLVAEREKRAVEPARAEMTWRAAIPRAVAALQPPRVPGPAAATTPAPVTTPVTPPGFTTPKAAPLQNPAVTTGGDQRVQPELP